jgi:hypothetical protein
MWTGACRCKTARSLISSGESGELRKIAGARPMFSQLLAGGLVSIFNFGIHALMTGLIVVLTRHVAGRTDDLHVFMRLSTLVLLTVVVLMVAHVTEIFVWATFMQAVGISAPDIHPFEFAFENYVALGYGDVVAGGGWRLIGPIMSLNGLILVGWSVAIIFEVVKMADVQIGKRETPAVDGGRRPDAN